LHPKLPITIAWQYWRHTRFYWQLLYFWNDNAARYTTR